MLSVEIVLILGCGLKTNRELKRRGASSSSAGEITSIQNLEAARLSEANQ
jgi:hypothetical protein